MSHRCWETRTGHARKIITTLSRGNTAVRKSKNRSAVVPRAAVSVPRAPAKRVGAATNTVSRAEAVYTQLLHAINSGHFKPGDRIREEAVAKSLRVSRTPVREALRRLQSEDVLAKSTQGLTVVEVSEDEVLELYSLRETLEMAAAQLAARHATPVNLRRLTGVLRKEAACREGDAMGLAAVNRNFHVALAEAAHNRFLLKTLHSLQDAFLRLPLTTLSMLGRPRIALGEHRAIVDAIARRDVTGAGKAARRHIAEARRLRLRLNKLVARQP